MYSVIGFGFVIFGLFFSGKMKFGGSGAMGEEIQNITRELMEIPSVKMISYGSAAVSVVLCGILIAAGILLLQRKMPGRTLSLVYAVAALIHTVIGSILQYLVVNRYYVELLAGSSLDEAVQSSMAMTMKFQPLFYICCFGLYPVLILVFLLPEKFARSLSETSPAEAPPAESVPPVEPPDPEN